MRSFTFETNKAKDYVTGIKVMFILELILFIVL